MTFCCAICSRPPSGYGWMSPKKTKSFFFDQSREILNGVNRRESFQRFCSMLCQSIYHDLYHKDITVNKNEIEIAARQQALSVLGDYVTRLGSNKPLGEYSQSDIDGLIDAVLTGYQDALKNIYKNEIPF